MARLTFLASALLVAQALATSYGSGSSNSQSANTEVITIESSYASDVEIIIIESNNGGQSMTQTWNQPAMNSTMTHMVTVGGTAGLVYSPDTITANVGDMIQFNFMSENHTVTQSSFNTPCIKLAGGVDSGFMPNPNNTVSPPPMMLFQVMVSTPIWMYCRQKGHCGKGMTFSVNPTAAKSQADFQAMAIAQNGTSSSSEPAASASSVAVATQTSSSSSVSTSSASVVAGTGSVGSGDVCSCSCLCGASQFAVDVGIGMTGGTGGMMPIVSTSTRKRSYRQISA